MDSPINLKRLSNLIIDRPLYAILPLAGLLRAAGIWFEPLWYDETFTAWLAQLPLPNMIAATLGDVHPPTWYLIEWLIVRLFGHGEAALRLVSWLAGLGLVLVTWRLAAALQFNRRAQIAAAVLVTVSPFFIFYGGEARAYSLLYFLAALATVGLIERRWQLFILSAVAMLWLHNLAVFYLAALGWLAVWNLRNDISDVFDLDEIMIVIFGIIVFTLYASFSILIPSLIKTLLPLIIIIVILTWLSLWVLRKKLSIFTPTIVPFAVVVLLWLPWVIWGLVGQAGDVSNGFWVRPITFSAVIVTAINLIVSDYSQVIAFPACLLLPWLITRIDFKHPATIPLAGLLIIPVGLSAILSAAVVPILVTRTIGMAALPLHLLLATVDWSKYRLLAAMGLAVLAVWYGMYLGPDGRSQWDEELTGFRHELRPDDGIYHANVATAIVWHYYLPDYHYAVWRQANDLNQSLTDETKAAMQMTQADFNAIACSRDRWWVAFYDNPTTRQAEREHILEIVARWGAKRFVTMQQDRLIDARLYLIDTRATCGRLAEVK